MSVLRLTGIPGWCCLVFLALSGSSARGAGGFAGFVDPRLGQLQPSLRYDGGAYPDAATDQGVDLGMSRHRLDLLVPLWQDERNELALNAGRGYLGIDSLARLERAGADLPDDFWDVQAGGAYRRRLENEWILGGALTVGSASDRPFYSYDELTINASALLRLPVGERDAALFFLNYANNREFLPHVPIPGAGYLWQPDRRLQIFAGIPILFVMWRPRDDLSLRFSYFPVRAVDARIGYSPLPPLEFFAGFEWENWRHFRAGRADEDDRVFYYEKRATAGIAWRVAPAFRIGLRGGYSFDRFFFEGEEYDDRDDSRIDVDDGAFVGAEVTIEWPGRE